MSITTLIFPSAPSLVAENEFEGLNTMHYFVVDEEGKAIGLGVGYEDTYVLKLIIYGEERHPSATWRADNFEEALQFMEGKFTEALAATLETTLRH